MTQISNIIFVSEFNEQERIVLEQAVDLARSNQAKLTIVRCFENLKILFLNEPNNFLLDDILDHERERLEQFVSTMLTEKIETEIKIFFDKPYVDIIREVIVHDADLLIKPVERTTSIKNVFFGSLDTKLLRTCPCPVWLVKPTEHKGHKRVVVAIDYETEDSETDSFNAQLLDMAVSLALPQFCNLHIVHAWQLEHESFLRSPRMGNTDAKVDLMVKEKEERRRKWLSNTVNKCLSAYGSETKKFLNPQLHLQKGNAKHVIPALIKKLEAELIIMGTIGRKGIPGYLIGNTAETILANIDCSVLAAKPRGFVCPLKID